MVNYQINMYPDIISLGELLVEIIRSELDTPHSTLGATYKGPFPSGAPAIFIDSAARIGKKFKLSTGFIGAIGDDDNAYNSGSAYVFERSGNTWHQVAKLTATDGDNQDLFGLSVSISSGYAIVGAPFNDEDGYNFGAAYIFHLSVQSDIVMPWIPLLLLND